MGRAALWSVWHQRQASRWRYSLPILSWPKHVLRAWHNLLMSKTLLRRPQTSWDASAGVLTKLDIMDRGTDASAMMRNQIVPLRLGYIGMVNRSQMDINLNRSIRDAGAAEAAFFETHPEYNEVQMATRLYTSTAIAGNRLRHAGGEQALIKPQSQGLDVCMVSSLALQELGRALSCFSCISERS